MKNLKFLCSFLITPKFSTTKLKPSRSTHNTYYAQHILLFSKKILYSKEMTYRKNRIRESSVTQGSATNWF